MEEATQLPAPDDSGTRFAHRTQIDPLALLRNASSALLLRVIGAACGYGLGILVARILGASGLGIISLGSTCVMVACVFGRFGLDNVILRLVATANSVADRARIRQVYRRSMRLSLIFSSIAAAILLISAREIADQVFNEPGLTNVLRILALSVIPASLITLHGEFLKGMSRGTQAMFIQTVSVPLLMSIALIAASTLFISVEILAVIQVSTVALTAALAAWLCLRLSTGVGPTKRPVTRKELLLPAHPLFWVAFMNVIMSYTDVVLLGMSTESVSVGIYAAAASSAALVNFVLAAVNTVTPPIFATLYAQQRVEDLARVARQSTLLMIIVTAPALCLLFLWPSIVLRLFGPDFTAGSHVLSILTIGQFVNVATGSVGYLLMMTGHEKWMRNNIIAMAFLNLLLCIILIPPYGMIGAAVATATSLSCMNLISMVLVYKKLSFVTFPIPMRFLARHD